MERRSGSFRNGGSAGALLIAVKFQTAGADEYAAVREFLSQMGWAERVADAERFRLMIERADRHVVAFEGERVVGFARALCDGVSNGYISMVAVAPDCRRRGIGRELIRRLVGDDPHITWVLRASRHSIAFWERLGFAPSQIAMERTRQYPAPSSP